MACVIGNAYLDTPCHEKVWFAASTEFVSRHGTVIKVLCALLGLKSSGALWRAMFNNTVRDMGFEPSMADPDAYGRAFAETDRVLCMLTTYWLSRTHQRSNLWIESSMWWASKLICGRGCWVGTNKYKYWSFSAQTHVRNAVKNVKLLLQEEGRGLRSTATTPFSSTNLPPMHLATRI